MARFLFAPFSIVAGLIAGALSKRLFDHVWGWIDEDEPPESRHRDISWGKLVAAALIQGAIFRGVRALTDHYSRRAFARTTGTWPGREHPEPE
jgi:hypothetical protein